MGKLVLFLADGTTMDIPLDTERLTIGRRADNDVCLPYPAVSGEHAVVVTILADSFLEDQGSTNGTLINGKGTVKHLLRDHDQIEIGRQRLTYVSDNDARVEPLPADIARNQIRGLTDQVQHQLRPPPKVVVHAGGARRPLAGGRGSALFADLQREVDDAPPAANVSPHESSVAAGGGASAAALAATGSFRAISALNASASPTPQASPPAATHSWSARFQSATQAPDDLPSSTNEKSSATESTVEVAGKPPTRPDTLPQGATLQPSVRVLSGPSLGRTVVFTKDEMTVGRAGVQVAVVRKVANGYILVPIEGAEPPRINGAAVATGGSPLHPGDTFEVAGVRLELSAG